MYKVYVKGFVGNLGTKVLIENKYEELSKHFSEEYIKVLIKLICETLEDGDNPSLSILDGIADVEKVMKGGILSALWKICERNKWGLVFNLREIPILQGTVEIANYFDINPYRLLSDNVFIFVSDRDYNSEEYYNIFKIGEIRNTKKRVRIDGESEAFLTKDYKDEIDIILPKYTKNHENKNRKIV